MSKALTYNKRFDIMASGLKVAVDKYVINPSSSMVGTVALYLNNILIAMFDLHLNFLKYSSTDSNGVPIYRLEPRKEMKFLHRDIFEE